MTPVLTDSTAAESVFVAPLVLHTPASLHMSDVEFFEFCQHNRDLRIEQTAEGDLILMPPAGGETGSRNFDIARQLGNWARADGTGVGFDSSTGFVLPNGAKRSLDASWVTRSRLAVLTPEQKQRFLPLCPDFVIELRSPSDRLADIQNKMAEYRDNGARLGWLIDPVERRIYVYRPGVPFEEVTDPATLPADPELPGFVLDLRDIWEPGF